MKTQYHLVLGALGYDLVENFPPEVAENLSIAEIFEMPLRVSNGKVLHLISNLTEFG